MRNYKEQVEAAYLTSRRQGDMMWDPALERSAHEDRRNRYLENEAQGGVRRYPSDIELRPQTMDSYRPADRGYNQMLDTNNNRGKGPRNYTRSDERIKEIVCDLLSDDPYLDASDIEVEVKNAEVVLTGKVDEKFSKRLAEHLVEDVSGITNIENRIRVRRWKGLWNRACSIS